MKPQVPVSEPVAPISVATPEPAPEVEEEKEEETEDDEKEKKLDDVAVRKSRVGTSTDKGMEKTKENEGVDDGNTPHDGTAEEEVGMEAGAQKEGEETPDDLDVETEGKGYDKPKKKKEDKKKEPKQDKKKDKKKEKKKETPKEKKEEETAEDEVTEKKDKKMEKKKETPKETKKETPKEKKEEEEDEVTELTDAEVKALVYKQRVARKMRQADAWAVDDPRMAPYLAEKPFLTSLFAPDTKENIALAKVIEKGWEKLETLGIFNPKVEAAHWRCVPAKAKVDGFIACKKLGSPFNYIQFNEKASAKLVKLRAKKAVFKGRKDPEKDYITNQTVTRCFAKFREITAEEAEYTAHQDLAAALKAIADLRKAMAESADLCPPHTRCFCM
mgnify:CR=1 FL=1